MEKNNKKDEQYETLCLYGNLKSPQSQRQSFKKIINRQDSADNFLKISKSQKLLLAIKYQMKAFKDYKTKLNKIEWTLNMEIININVIEDNNRKLIKKLINQTIRLQ